MEIELVCEYPESPGQGYFVFMMILILRRKRACNVIRIVHHCLYHDHLVV